MSSISLSLSLCRSLCKCVCVCVHQVMEHAHDEHDVQSEHEMNIVSLKHIVWVISY